MNETHTDKSHQDSERILNTETDKECPKCGAPIDDVRVACRECGYEYKDEDYTDKDAGHDLTAGAQVDDEGNEIIENPDEGKGPDPEA